MMPLTAIHEETRQLLLRYQDYFPTAPRFATLARQLASGEDLFARSNMTGHVTASAAVLNEDGGKILLIEHVFLQRRLVPGGHYEAPGGLLDSALREVREETGAYAVAPHPWTLRHGVPLDVDSHPIPANPNKGEGAHWHHDFMFLAVAQENDVLTAQLEEVHGAAWHPLSVLAALDDARLRRVHERLTHGGLI